MKKLFSISLLVLFSATIVLTGCKSSQGSGSPYRGKSGKSKRKSKCNCPGYTFSRLPSPKTNTNLPSL